MKFPLTFKNYVQWIQLEVPIVLEESMVDMLASNWERKLGGGEGVTAKKIGDVAEGFLERYLPEDRQIVRDLLDKIKNSEL